MAQINICNSAGRDALVTADNMAAGLKVRWVDDQGRQASSVRLLKAPVEKDVASLQSQFGDLGRVANALIETDPEIDLENTGRYLRETTRVYIGPDRAVVHRAEFWEIIRNPDGTERERRPRKLLDANVAGRIAVALVGQIHPESRRVPQVRLQRQSCNFSISMASRTIFYSAWPRNSKTRIA